MTARASGGEPARDVKNGQWPAAKKDAGSRGYSGSPAGVWGSSAKCVPLHNSRSAQSVFIFQPLVTSEISRLVRFGMVML